MIGYLRDRIGLPLSAVTPVEIEAHLGGSGYSASRVAATVELLRRCDEARFGPVAVSPALAGDAERLILDWEAAL